MTNKSSNFNMWSIVAILALLALNGYQWFANNQMKTENVRQETELLELEKVNAELDQDYSSALSSLEDLRGDNKELNDLIDSQKKELMAQKDKINNLIWTKRELNKAREEMDNLKSQAASYVAELTKLRDENALLASSNTQLRQANETLNVQYTEVAAQREKLAEQRAVLAAEKERLAETNEVLDEKVDMANAIKINYLEVQGYEVKDNGKRRKRNKGKDIDLLEVCVKTETNMVVSPGAKIFYVRIIDPLGETVVAGNEGSGVLTNKLDNTKVRYTYEGLINYNNADTEDCVGWMLTDDVDLPKGQYEIEMYNNGYPVGTGSFKLK